jgi:hypothetical protein
MDGSIRLSAKDRKVLLDCEIEGWFAGFFLAFGRRQDTAAVTLRWSLYRLDRIGLQHTLGVRPVVGAVDGNNGVAARTLSLERSETMKRKAEKQRIPVILSDRS